MYRRPRSYFTNHGAGSHPKHDVINSYFSESDYDGRSSCSYSQHASGKFHAFLAGSFTFPNWSHLSDILGLTKTTPGDDARILTRPTLSPDDLQERVITAQARFNDQQFDAAIEILEYCINSAPHNHSILFLLGASHYHVGDATIAHKMLLKAAQLNKKDPLYNYYLGLSYRRTGQRLFALIYLELAEAFAEFDSALKQSAAIKLAEIRAENTVVPFISARPRIRNFANQIIMFVMLISASFYIHNKLGLTFLNAFPLIAGIAMAIYIMYNIYSTKYEIAQKYILYCHGIIKDREVPIYFISCKHPQGGRRYVIDRVLCNKWIHLDLSEPITVFDFFNRKNQIDDIWIPSLGNQEFMDHLLMALAARVTWAKFIVESQTDRQK